MKILYFDCSSGISGNMVLGALTEIIGDEQYLTNELKKLNIDGYQLVFSKMDKNGIYGTHVNVIVDGEDEYGHVHHIDGHDHHDYHGHSHEHDGHSHEHMDHNHDHHGHSHDHHAHGYDHHDHNHDYHGHSHEHHDHNHEYQDHSHDHHDHNHEYQDHSHDHHAHSHDYQDHNHDHHDHSRHDHHDHSHSHGHHHHGDHDHDHSYHHHHAHRNLADVNSIIDKSSLSNQVKDLAKRIFLRVARAESKVHGKDLSEVHFHEVGAVDSIVDIVGTAILMDYIHPDRVISSIVNEGHGFIRCAHGLMSVPVPATSEIMADSDVIFRQIDVDTELVTPTGAAIIAELADSFVPLPAMKIEKIGWGAGTKELPVPNLLKVYLGDLNEDRSFVEGDDEKDSHREKEDFVVIETNIDDCPGEILGYTMDKLFDAGALDVFFTPVFMKKNRPAYRLTVSCRRGDLNKLAGIIFKETTTIGIRYRYENRIRLNREEVDVPSPYGIIKGKKVNFEGESYIYPEYESAREIAESAGIPLKELYRRVKD